MMIVLLNRTRELLQTSCVDRSIQVHGPLVCSSPPCGHFHIHNSCKNCELDFGLTMGRFKSSQRCMPTSSYLDEWVKFWILALALFCYIPLQLHSVDGCLIQRCKTTRKTIVCALIILIYVCAFREIRKFLKVWWLLWTA